MIILHNSASTMSIGFQKPKLLEELGADNTPGKHAFAMG
jgi:hypothetical protein